MSKPSEPTDTPRFCSNCGADLGGPQKFCSFCGTELQKHLSSKSNDSSTSSDNGKDSYLGPQEVSNLLANEIKTATLDRLREIATEHPLGQHVFECDICENYDNGEFTWPGADVAASTNVDDKLQRLIWDQNDSEDSEPSSQASWAIVSNPSSSGNLLQEIWDVFGSFGYVDDEDLWLNHPNLLKKTRKEILDFIG